MKTRSQIFLVENNTLIDDPNTIKQASPLVFPNLSAAFKPFKKRSMSFHNTTNIQININDVSGLNSGQPNKKRDEKAYTKANEETD